MFCFVSIRRNIELGATASFPESLDHSESDGRTRFKTPCLQNTLNPVWNRTSILQLVTWHLQYPVSEIPVVLPRTQNNSWNLKSGTKTLALLTISWAKLRFTPKGTFVIWFKIQEMVNGVIGCEWHCWKRGGTVFSFDPALNLSGLFLTKSLKEIWSWQVHLPQAS